MARDITEIRREWMRFCRRRCDEVFAEVVDREPSEIKEENIKSKVEKMEEELEDLKDKLEKE